MSELTRRMASLDDVQGIWGLIRQVSAEIPFKMDDEREQEGILSELMACCTSGLSPLLVDNEKGIVGALLARRDDFEWCFRNGETIHVAYAAVSPEAKEEKVLPALLGELQDRKVPLLASVKSGEQLGFATALGELGFTHEVKAASGWGDLYQWMPPASVHN
ncbi:hypothetical protein V5F59_15445 [Xanthobacter autotrophicus DSM 431]|uniref:hypothetical protein n=1 Tax=Xanthobacter nonsaccharivorans TaxID=3119912 RepID=UPI003727435B